MGKTSCQKHIFYYIISLEGKKQKRGERKSQENAERAKRE
jgi:hypothetical protein